MVDRGETVRVRLRLSVADVLEVRGEVRVRPVALDEAEGDVVEGRRDAEGPESPAAGLVRLDVGEKGPAALVEEFPGPFDAPHAEGERRDAVGVDPEVARGAGVLPDGGRDEDADVTRSEDRGLLAPLLHLRGGGRRDLGEAHRVGVEAPAAGDVGDDEVEGVVSEDSERFGHGGSLDRVSGIGVPPHAAKDGRRGEAGFRRINRVTRTPPTRAPAGVFFVRHLPLFLDYLAVEKGLAKNSLEAYRRDLSAFGAFSGRTPPVDRRRRPGRGRRPGSASSGRRAPPRAAWRGRRRPSAASTGSSREKGS